MARRLALWMSVVSVLVAAPAFAGPLARVYIAPGNVGLVAGGSQQFVVRGVDADGHDVAVTDTVTWSVVNSAAGAIDQAGSFVAGTVPGNYFDSIKASIPSGLWAAAEVDVLAAAANEGNVVFERGFGGRAPTEFNFAWGMAVDSHGNTYVVDTYYNNRIMKFDATGQYVKQWGTTGNGSGQFDFPVGIAIDASDCIYVADDGNNRVCKFDSDGRFLTAWGCSGTGNGCFQGVTDVAVDPAGYVYALDYYGNRVQKFDLSGHFVAQWGTQGAGDGQFVNPNSIAVDSASNVYVFDRGGYRIQKFDSSGAFITKWGSRGTGSGQFGFSATIAIGPGDVVFVGDESRVQRFDSSGAFLGQWGSRGRAMGQLDTACDVAMCPDGNIAVLDSYNGRVNKFTLLGAYITSWSGFDDADFYRACWVDTDGDGNIYVAEEDRPWIRKYSRNGAFITKWQALDDVNDLVGGLAVSRLGYVYYGCRNKHWIKKFDTSGNRLATWNTGYCPDDLVADASGNLYAGCWASETISMYSPSGQLVTCWGSKGTGDGQFGYGIRLALDASSNVYVTDEDSPRVQKFGPYGGLLLKWELQPGSDGVRAYPKGIAVDANGTVWVAEVHTNAIQKFDSTGQFLGKWGGFGHEFGSLFYYAEDIAVDPWGSIIVSENMGRRVQKFAPAISSLGSAKNVPDGGFVFLSGPAVTAGTGQLPDCCYVESIDRSAGIKVTGKTQSMSRKVNVIGYFATVDGEREIRATSMPFVGYGSAAAFMMTNKAVGGGDTAGFDPVTNVGQRGVEDGEGANNIGLLVRTTGTVTIVGDDFFYIDDGTHAHDATIFTGVRVQCGNLPKPIIGQHAAVSGISRIVKLQGRYFRSVWPRYAADITITP